MIEEQKVSKSLLEVWEWKDACCQEVMHLPRREALRTLLTNAERTARGLNLKLQPMSLSRSKMVAEEHREYGGTPGSR
jgi:hypothetical protein